MAFEQNQRIEIEDVKTELGKKVNTANVLTLEEIQATTDLTGKVASASSAKELNNNKYHVYGLSRPDDARQEVSIGAAIIDNVGYIIFNIHWISLRLKVIDTSTSTEVYVSCKYGNNGFSNEAQIARIIKG